jgi:hypothetical protein
MTEPLTDEELDHVENEIIWVLAPELARRLIEEIRATREALRFVRQTVHQAHHDGWSIETCPKNICDAVAQALGEKPPPYWHGQFPFRKLEKP